MGAARTNTSMAKTLGSKDGFVRPHVSMRRVVAFPFKYPEWLSKRMLILISLAG
jgi:hypothetical protein